MRRVGFGAPGHWKEERDLELDFEGVNGVSTFRVIVGPVAANDVRVTSGAALELSVGQLREEDPELYAQTVAAWWTMREPDADWAIGARLSRPVRLEMTAPYRETVGFSFQCERSGMAIGRMMLFAEADILFIVRDDHPEVAKYGLQAESS